MKFIRPVLDQVEQLVLSGTVTRLRLRRDVWRQLVLEARADAWGTHWNEGPVRAVRVCGVLVTQREDDAR